MLNSKIEKELLSLSELFKKHLGIDLYLLKSKDRSAHIIRHRQLFCLFAYNKGFTYFDIGLFLGGRHHSTILWSVRKALTDISLEYSDTIDMYNTIKNHLEIGGTQIADQKLTANVIKIEPSTNKSKLFTTNIHINTFRVPFNHFKSCSSCNHSGFVNYTFKRYTKKLPCPICNGKGYTLFGNHKMNIEGIEFKVKDVDNIYNLAKKLNVKFVTIIDKHNPTLKIGEILYKKL